MSQKQYTKKQITELEIGFDHQPPTAFELVEAVFGDEEYSPKLALQARVWIAVEVPNSKRMYGSDIYGTGIKRGQIIPEIFPVVDVKQRGRSKIALVCSKPSMHHEALTFMELKSKFLDAKVRKDDVVTAECGGLPVGDIVAVNVHSGRIPGEGRYYGGGQHVVVIKCIGSQEFTKSRDEGRLGAADIRESSKYTKKQISEAIKFWKGQLEKLDEGYLDQEHDRLADYYAHEQDWIASVSRELERMPKTPAQQAKYEKVKALAKDSQDLDFNGSAAEALAYDMFHCGSDLSETVPSSKKNDYKLLAKAVLRLVMECPAEDAEGYLQWIAGMCNAQLDESIDEGRKCTKKQITEAIAYWKKQLKRLNESTGFGKKYDHTDPSLGDKYSNSAYGPSLTWGELKEIGDKAMSDDDTVDNIALICGPDDVAFGEGICYLDVDKNVENTLVFSIAGY